MSNGDRVLHYRSRAGVDKITKLERAMEIQYLNTDLEIESKNDLAGIVEEFGEDVSVLYQGERRGYQFASFEIPAANAGADEVINSFCLLVENLPSAARKIWDECCARVFNVGYESGTAPQDFRSEVRATTIQRVAAIGGSIVITIYPVPDASRRKT